MTVGLKLEEHWKEEGGDVLGFAFEPDELDENGVEPDWREECEDVLLLDIDVPDAVWAGFAVLDVLGNTQDPFLAFVSQVIMDIEELVDDIDNGFDGVTLVDFGGFIENEEGHFFGHDLIIFAQVIHQIKVLCLEVDYFAHVLLGFLVF